MPQLTSMKINKPLPKIIDSFCMAVRAWSHDHMTHPFIDQALLIDHHWGAPIFPPHCWNSGFM